MIVGNVIGGHPVTPRTYIIQMDNGEEVPAVLVGSETVFTATANDIREGKVAASDTGIVTGDKVIPAYHTSEGYRIITPGSSITIPNLNTSIDSYDYTKLQAMVCIFNINETNSVQTEKVSIGNSVYNVQSTEPISEVTKDHESKIIDFGILNESDGMQILRFFMYKEIK